ncbi:helicase associated domain-containing protein [Brevibacterium atlanticum]|uniref:helicase associated domain-containing protein n=1 Tax=Brevibacterium atlanticum TaxID=2697563 RepID=UPI00224BA249|nr:helicase associated domain-containing protein [Brevibacterium atlanticum]
MVRQGVDFERGMARLASYARTYGHANPKNTEVWLDWKIGLWVRELRNKHRAGKLSDSQVAEAKGIGLRFEPPYRDKPVRLTGAQRRESEQLARLESLQPFYKEHGHINVKQIDGLKEWPRAGAWIARLRQAYRQGKLPSRVVEKAEAMGIAWKVSSRPKY